MRCLSAALALLLTAASGFAGVRGDPKGDPAALTGLTGPLGEGASYALLATGDVRGWLEPCG